VHFTEKSGTIAGQNIERVEGMTEWIKTNFPGVRYREHKSRRHGKVRDKYFTIRYKVSGKDKEEGLGWSSEEWSAAKAYDQLKELKENIKRGDGPQTMAEKRAMEAHRKETERAEREADEKEQITFKQYFDDTYYPASRIHKKKHTYSKEETHFRIWIAPVIGNKPLKKVSEFDIRRITKNILDAGKAPRTAQYIMATIRQVWNMARRDGLTNIDSPTKNVKIPKFDNRRQRFLSQAEASLLLNMLKEKSEQVYQMAFLGLYTGMRASEIFNLTWGCIDTDRSLITIMDAKSGHGRTAFMIRQVKSMFLDMTKGKNDDLVFPNKAGGVYYEIPHTFKKAIEKLKFNDGVGDPRQRVCFHTLRHSFGSWHAEAGTDLYVIKSLMGHGSITLTERYSHLSLGTLQNATKNLEEAVNRTGQDKDERAVNYEKE